MRMITNGFELVDKDYIKDYKAEGFLYRHVKTGFEVFYVEKEDDELFFSYAFPTPPSASDGVFHIIEHTVLSGSRRYPVRDPFTLVSQGSVNTYMNALTCPDMTLYPAASPVKKDFDNLFYVYTDALFDPLLRYETFLQEGIRLTEKGFDGVVFNEMRGDESQSESVVATHSVRDLFKGGPYSRNSGGEVLGIASLTYEKYLETYKRFYSASNGHLFLYGKGCDISSKLAFLDEEYLSKRERTAKTELLFEAERWASPISKEIPSAAMDGDDKCTFMLSFLTSLSNSSSYDVTFLSILVDILLGSPSCPLYKAILDSGLGDDISSQSGMSSDFPLMPFAVGLTGVDKEKKAEVEAFLLDALAKICREGLDSDVVEAAIRRQEFVLEEIPGGIPSGFRIFLKSIKPWLREEDIFSSLRPSDDLKQIRAALKESPDLFERWMEKELLCNPHRLSLLVYPDADLMLREQQKLDAVAAERGFCKEDVMLYEAFAASFDSIDALNTVPHLSLADLPSRSDIIEEEVHDHIILQAQDTGPVIYLDVVIDISDLTDDQLRAASLLSRYIMIAGRKGEAKEILHKQLRLASGSYSCFLETGRSTDDRVVASFIFRMKVMKDQYGNALELLSDLLNCLDCSDEKAMKAALSDMISDFAEYIEYSGSSFAASAASASLTTSLSVGEEVMGIKAWKYFDTLSLEDALASCCEVYCRLTEKDRCTIHITCSEELCKESLSHAREFFSSFSSRSSISSSLRCVKTEEDVSYALSSSVAYNASAIKVSPWCTRQQEAESLVANMLSSGELYNEIRTFGGAYGVYAQLDSIEEYMVISTYRDPHVALSFEHFISSIERMEINDELLAMAKMQLLGRLLKPLSPQQRAMVAIHRRLYGVKDEDRVLKREYTASITTAEAEEARGRILEAFKSAHRASLAPKSLYEKEPLDLVLSALPRA